MITLNPKNCKVHVGGVPLDPEPSLKLRNHSPDGFAWGYFGSGPAQLSLALLLHFTDRQFALDNYQQFKFDVVGGWPKGQKFHIPNRVVTDWIKKHGGELL